MPKTVECPEIETNAARRRRDRAARRARSRASSASRTCSSPRPCPTARSRWTRRAGAAQVDAHRPLRRRRGRSAATRPTGCKPPATRDVALLDGGNRGWAAAGYGLFKGVNVPSKLFGELVEHEYHTPRVTVHELVRMKEAREEFRDRGRPSVLRVHEDEHSRGHLLSERRASLPHPGHREESRPRKSSSTVPGARVPSSARRR